MLGLVLDLLLSLPGTHGDGIGVHVILVPWDYCRFGEIVGKLVLIFDVMRYDLHGGVSLHLWPGHYTEN
jgi:hypothetical protein